MTYNKILSNFIKDSLKDEKWRTFPLFDKDAPSFLRELNEYCQERNLILHVEVYKGELYTRIFTKIDFELYQSEDTYTVKFSKEDQ